MVPAALRTGLRGLPVGLKAKGAADFRRMTAGDGNALVGAGVGVEEQRPLEALLDFPYPAQVDEEPAVDAQESLVCELPFQVVEAPGSGQEPSLVAHQPDVVAVGFGETDLS